MCTKRLRSLNKLSGSQNACTEHLTVLTQPFLKPILLSRLFTIVAQPSSGQNMSIKCLPARPFIIVT